MGNRVGWRTLVCYVIIAASLAIGIIALVSVNELRAEVDAISAPVRVPVFRAKGNMMTLADGTLCVESAAIPAGVSLQKSSARRVEGRFYMVRAADPRKTARDESAGAAAPTPGVVAPAVDGCASQIVDGARWRAPYEVIVDPTNYDGIPHHTFLDGVQNGIDAWDAFLTTPIVSNVRAGELADGFDDDSPDGKNEIMLGNIEEEGVLAVTVIWGVFGGPVDEREIIETDMLYNLHYPWGLGNPIAHDIWNIATHEQGHALGIAHTNTNGASMFPTASPGETHKRDALPCEIEALRTFYEDAGSNKSTIPTNAAAVGATVPLAPLLLSVALVLGVGRGC